MPSAPESSTTQISETRVDEKTKLTFTRCVFRPMKNAR